MVDQAQLFHHDSIGRVGASQRDNTCVSLPVVDRNKVNRGCKRSPRTAVSHFKEVGRLLFFRGQGMCFIKDEDDQRRPSIPFLTILISGIGLQ